MSITMQDVMKQIDREEPDYGQAARLGADAIAHLRQLIQGRDAGLAAKAAYLAGIIDVPDSGPALELAARHASPVVRVAAASASAKLKTSSPALAMAFLTDVDPGVRKWGLRAAARARTVDVKKQVQAIHDADVDPHLRELARSVLDRLKQN